MELGRLVSFLLRTCAHSYVGESTQLFGFCVHSCPFGYIHTTNRIKWNLNIYAPLRHKIPKRKRLQINWQNIYR